MDIDAFKVRNGYFVRRFRRNDNWRGNLPVEQMRAWMTLDGKSRIIDGKFIPVKDRPEMVIWEPLSGLNPGVYYISIESSNARQKPREMEPFFYRRTSALAGLETSDRCVDYFQYFMSPERRYYPCAQNYSGD